MLRNKKFLSINDGQVIEGIEKKYSCAGSGATEYSWGALFSSSQKSTETRKAQIRSTKARWILKMKVLQNCRGVFILTTDERKK